MTLRPYSILRTGLLVATAALAPTAAHASDWRQAHVRSVSPRSDVDSAVDVECAPQRVDAAGLQVLVVSYRVGKSLQWRAFNLAADDHYAVGDDVIINVASCLVARQPQPADVAASSP